MGQDAPPIIAESDEITAYWDERAVSYSNSVADELGGPRRDSWERAIDGLTQEKLAQARREDRMPRVLDLGCGPGFFSILFSERGARVDALDASLEMLAKAQANYAAAPAGEGHVMFHHGDISSLPFPDNTFDVAISRNVTWLMTKPEITYAEWIRVLRPGGKLIIFDANWYLYLCNDEVDAARKIDQSNNALEERGENMQATVTQQKRCEEIALKLPLTPILRPAWDIDVLTKLGITTIRADESIGNTLWTADEQAYYASSPLFLVEAVK